jgi:hypothetical protein
MTESTETETEKQSLEDVYVDKPKLNPEAIADFHSSGICFKGWPFSL